MEDIGAPRQGPRHFGRGKGGGEVLFLAEVARAVPELRMADAGRAMLTDDLAVLVFALDVVDEEILRDRHVALHAEDLGDVGDAAGAIAQPLRLDDDVDRRADHLADRPGRQPKPPVMIIDSMRAIASRGEFACSVPIEPSWPVFIACRRSKVSGPRTSPTMMRSGRMRRQFFTRSRMVTCPALVRYLVDGCSITRFHRHAVFS